MKVAIEIFDGGFPFFLLVHRRISARKYLAAELNRTRKAVDKRLELSRRELNN